MARRLAAAKEQVTAKAAKDEPKTSVESLYAARDVASSEVVFDIPNTGGVDVYLFAGPTPRDAVRRYNLFSGGGAMPPLWGLGMKYRTHTRFTAKDVLDIATEIREERVPCDVLGLEPGWHTHAYSCSFVWSDKRYPDHEAFLKRLFDMDYRVNLWEHAYIHPTSPMYKPLLPLSGDYQVWGGIVPDFTLKEAERIFADYHDRNLIAKGITSFKGDECDKQPIGDVTPFNFPFCATFPSGIDGERYAQLFGTLYQRTLYRLFRKHDLRTWGDIRAGGSLAAPSPFNLYSDAYDQAQYLRQQLNAGMAGLLWSPEVRQAGSVEELVSRVGMTVYAPQMCLKHVVPRKTAVEDGLQVERRRCGQGTAGGGVRSEYLPQTGRTADDARALPVRDVCPIQ